MKNIESIKIENEELIQVLIKKVFNNAMEVSKETNAHSLSKYLMTEMDNKINDRTLTRYYNGYILDKIEERKSPSSYNLDILSSYLGFNNYLDFIANHPNKDDKNMRVFNKKSKIASVSAIVLLASYVGYDTTKKDCMVWTENNIYQSISCDEKSNLESIPKDVYILENFKRIEPDCSYTFFKINGEENLWYGKNREGKLEFFTALSFHPETRKTLKPITEYMIRKHICESYK